MQGCLTLCPCERIQNGVKVVSATERISDSPEGILMESLLEGMAEYYSAELSEKIHRGQKDNALKGLNNGGSVPLGYVLNKQTQRLEIDSMTAPIVQEIFRRYADGDTIKEIRDDLNERGIRTKKGQPFRYSSFSVLLKNRKYIGEYKYQDVVTPDGLPAIIPKYIFDRVQARLEKNKRTPAAAKAPERYLLATKLFCGECGKMMTGESGTSGTNGKIYRYYKCYGSRQKNKCKKKPVKKEWIENFVVQQPMAVIMDGPLMERIIDRLVELQGEENYDLRLLEQQLKQAEKGIENMLDAIQQGIITASTKQRLASLEEEKTRLEQSIIEAKIKNPALSREQIAYFLDQFKNTDINDEDQRQRLIDCFVNAVYVFDDKIVLTFNYKNGTKTIGLDAVKSSDLVGCCPPL